MQPNHQTWKSSWRLLQVTLRQSSSPGVRIEFHLWIDLGNPVEEEYFSKIRKIIQIPCNRNLIEQRLNDLYLNRESIKDIKVDISWINVNINNETLPKFFNVLSVFFQHFDNDRIFETFISWFQLIFQSGRWIFWTRI
jgi:hypothetical protein